MSMIDPPVSIPRVIECLLSKQVTKGGHSDARYKCEDEKSRPIGIVCGIIPMDISVISPEKGE
jgi:hypothetical protein